MSGGEGMRIQGRSISDLAWETERSRRCGHRFAYLLRRTCRVALCLAWPPVLFLLWLGTVQACRSCGNLPTLWLKCHARPSAKILFHLQYARGVLPILERRSWTYSGRSLAGCRRNADHACVGRQYGLDTKIVGWQRTSAIKRASGVYPFCPIIIHYQYIITGVNLFSFCDYFWRIIDSPIIFTLCNIANLFECMAMFYFVKRLSALRIVTKSYADHILFFVRFPVLLHHQIKADERKMLYSFFSFALLCTFASNKSCLTEINSISQNLRLFPSHYLILWEMLISSLFLIYSYLHIVFFNRILPEPAKCGDCG